MCMPVQLTQLVLGVLSPPDLFPSTSQVFPAAGALSGTAVKLPETGRPPQSYFRGQSVTGSLDLSLRFIKVHSIPSGCHEIATELKWGLAACYHPQANSEDKVWWRGKGCLLKCCTICEDWRPHLQARLFYKTHKKPKTVPRIPAPSLSILWSLRQLSGLLFGFRLLPGVQHCHFPCSFQDQQGPASPGPYVCVVDPTGRKNVSPFLQFKSPGSNFYVLQEGLVPQPIPSYS